MLPAGSGFQLLIFEFSGNPEIQQGYGLHNVVFRPAAAALGIRPADVPGYRQQEELTDSFDISGWDSACLQPDRRLWAEGQALVF